MKLSDLPNSPPQQYRINLIRRQSTYPSSQFLSIEPHVRNRQINSMVLKFANSWEERVAQNMKPLLSKFKGLLGKMWIR